ncbi:MAG: hypothetical protein MUO30_07500 [Anaerolineales bacterium]|nr:hypothetical protein [Anaerolineales bacterium]
MTKTLKLRWPSSRIISAESHVELREPFMSKPPSAPRRIWIMLEAPEVIELKRIAIDRDGDGAIAFFRDVLVARARRRPAARHRLGYACGGRKP